MRASHVLCVVDDLAAGVKAYEDAGFTVEWGDRVDAARNALIWFEEGPFLELIVSGTGPPRPIWWLLSLVARNGMIRRFQGWERSEAGWCDLALECDGDVKPVVESVGTAVGKIAGPFSSKRTPPSGRQITTQTAFPHDPRLPLMMGAYRPDPRPAQISHLNGATGIASISIDVPAACRSGWAALLDQDDPWIELVTSSGESGVREVSLHGLGSDLDPAAVCGAVITAA
ncbi:MAG: VOC family protein [Actinomycetota bacterium]